MKKVFLTLLTAIVTIGISTANNVSVTTKGDSTVVIENGDTTIIKGMNIGKFVNGILDDTVVNLNNDEESEANSESASTTMSEKAFQERQLSLQKMVERIVRNVMVGIVLIVLLSLLFYYMHRRAKYKIIEKAIENNYPLPDSMISGKSYVQQPPVMSQQPLPNQQFAQSQQSTEWQASQAQSPMPPVFNWRKFQSSCSLIAVGLGSTLFFFYAGATELIGLCSILIFIGIGRAFIDYQEQKSEIARQQWFMQQQQWQASQQPQQESESVAQPPVFNAQDCNNNNNNQQQL